MDLTRTLLLFVSVLIISITKGMPAPYNGLNGPGLDASTPLNGRIAGLNRAVVSGRAIAVNK